MELYRCRCGQPLAGFVNDLGGIGLPTSRQYVTRAVADALERHLDQVQLRADWGPSGHAVLGPEPLVDPSATDAA